MFGEREKIEEMLEEAYAAYDEGDWPTAKNIASEACADARRLAEDTRLLDDELLLASVLLCLGRSEHALGNSAGAVTALQEALQIRRDNSQTGVDELAEAVGELGLSYLQQRDLPQAEALLREALELDRQASFGDPTQLVWSLVNHATALLQMDQWPKAESHFREAAQLSEGQPELQIELVGTLLDRLCQWVVHWFEQGEIDKAMPAARYTAELAQMDVDVNAGLRLSAFINLADCCLAQKQPEQAYENARQALELAKEHLRADNPLRANIHSLLGHAQLELNQPQAAIKELEQAASIYQTAEGEHQEALVDSWSSLAALLLGQEDYGRGESYLRQTLGLMQRDDDLYRMVLIDALHLLHSIGTQYYRAGNLEAALRPSELSWHLANEHQDLDDDVIPGCIANYPEILRALGRNDEAEPLFQQALQFCRTKFGNDDPNVAQLLVNIGNLHFLQNNVEKAKPYYQQALDIHRKLEGEDGPHYRRLQAELQVTMGNVEDKRAALSDLQATLDESSPDFPIQLNATLFQLLGQARTYLHETQDFQELFQVANQACALVEKHTELCDPALWVTSLANRALAHDRLGRTDAAETDYRRAIGLAREKLPANHAMLPQLFNGLAAIFQRTGNFGAAELLLQEAVDVTRAIHGETSDPLATALGNLAYLYQNAGNLVAAEEFYQQCLDLYRKMHPPQHPLVSAMLSRLAHVQDALGKRAEAETYFRECLACDRVNLDPRHVDLGRTLVDYGYLLVRTDRPAEAEPMLREGLDIMRASLGEEEDSYIEAELKMATCQQKKRNFAEAEKIFEQQLAKRRQQLGDQHPSVAVIHSNMGSMYQEADNFSEADDHFRQAAKSYAASLGDQHPEYALCLANHAKLCREHGDLERAVTLLRESLAIRQRVFGLGHEIVGNTLALINEVRQEMSPGEEIEPESLLVGTAVYTSGGLITFEDHETDHLEHIVGAFAELDEIGATYTEHSSEFAASLNRVAKAFRDMGRWGEAETYYNRARTTHQTLGDDTSAGYATVLYNLASLYRDTGRYAQALPLCEKALKLRRDVLLAQDRQLADSLNDLALLRVYQNRFADAWPLFTEALDIYSQTDGEESYPYIHCLVNSVTAHETAGHTTESRELWQQALDLGSKVLDEKHPLMQQIRQAVSH